MGMPKAVLPQLPQIAAEYREGESFRTLGERYGVSPGTIRSRLQQWAAEHDQPWPLKPYEQRHVNNRDSVEATLVVAEVHYATRRLHVTQSQIAQVAGLKPNHLHKIVSGHSTRILRSTQGAILEAISKIEAGEVALERRPVMLPAPVRDHCPNGHPYTGKRDSDGKRMCSVCRAEKHRRHEIKRTDRKRIRKAS